jgi:hypothetical protein
MSTISQREARRLKKRVRELEERIRMQNVRWASEWPGGVEIASFTDVGELVSAEIRTARLLGHAAVCTVNQANVVRIFGVKL